MEIDHIIPDSISKDKPVFEQLLHRFELPSDFDVNSLLNLVPTHGSCNRRKSDTQFSDSSLRYYLELVDKKHSHVKEQIERLNIQTQNEHLLISIAQRIEKRLISTQEVDQFLSPYRAPTAINISEPIVVTLSTNVTEILDQKLLPSKAPRDYPKLCDWLERRVLRAIRSSSKAIIVACEASERDGETLSIRVASWFIDIDKLAIIVEPWWVITEIAPYSEIYDSPSSLLFQQALVQTANDLVHTRSDGLRRSRT